MNTISLLLACYVGTVGFALIFKAPPKSLLWCGFIGTLGYGVYLMSISIGMRETMSIFAAASVVGIASEILARTSRMPATVYIIAGILPLVPGAAAYLSMLAFVQGNYREALVSLSQVGTLSMAIAAGLAVGTMFRRRGGN